MAFFIKKDSFDLIFAKSVIALFCAFFIFGAGCAGQKRPPAPAKYKKLYNSKRYSVSSKSSKPYKIGDNWYCPMPDARGFNQRGKASWYGKKFHGRKTASGEIYNMYSMSAAHKTLPLGTWVKVHNMKNGREIEVRINDRGPFVKGRIIDLSYAAAKKLGIVETGTAPVEIAALGMAERNQGKNGGDTSYASVDCFNGSFTIQVGAFSDLNNAKRLIKKLDQFYKNVHINRYYNGQDTLYRVRVGRCSTLKQAAEYEKILMQNGFGEVFTVAE